MCKMYLMSKMTKMSETTYSSSEYKASDVFTSTKAESSLLLQNKLSASSLTTGKIEV